MLFFVYQNVKLLLFRSISVTFLLRVYKWKALWLICFESLMVWNSSDALYLYLGRSYQNVGQNTRYSEDLFVIVSPSRQILPQLRDDRFRAKILYFIIHQST